MKTIRAFIAIELTPEIRQQITLIIQKYQQLVPSGWVKWVTVENLHLTMKFLGDTDLNLIPSIQSSMDRMAATIPQFPITAAAAGMFPSARKPRIVWIGLDNKIGLTGLSKSLDDSLAVLKIAREERPFSPHLTIGRVFQGMNDADLAKLGETVLLNQPGEIGKMNVDHISLVKSDLKPAGPIYTVIHTAKLS